MKLALCQINPIIGDFDYNTSLIMNGVNRAKEEGCSLAIFPELSLLGYPPRDLLDKPAFVEENLKEAIPKRKAYGQSRLQKMPAVII